MAQDYLNNGEQNRRIRGTIGKQSRFDINMDELRSYNPRLSAFVMKHPIEAIKMFEDQLNQTVKGMQEDGGKAGSEKTANAADLYFPKKSLIYHVNFEGNFGKNHVTPRGLKADLVN